MNSLSVYNSGKPYAVVMGLEGLSREVEEKISEIGPEGAWRYFLNNGYGDDNGCGDNIEGLKIALGDCGYRIANSGKPEKG